LLYQVAPSNLAMSPGELAGLVEGLGNDETALGCRRLVELSLLTEVGEGPYQVHRWTAEALRTRDLDAHRGACLRLADRRMKLGATSPTLHNEVEALRNLIAAEAHDDACRLAIALCEGPLAQNQLAV